MAVDPDFVNLVEISSKALETLQAKPWDFLQLSNGETSSILQALSHREDTLDNTAYLDPLLYETLHEASMCQAGVNDEHTSDPSENGLHCRIALSPYSPAACQFNETNDRKETNRHWSLRRVFPGSIPRGSVIQVECLYVELSESFQSLDMENLEWMLSRALFGQVICRGGILIVPTCQGNCVLFVQDINVPDGEATGNIFLLDGRPGSFSVELAVSGLEEEIQPSEYQLQDWDPVDNCPGYETLVESLSNLLELPDPAAPSGLLLTGCAGVGKTRLVACMATRLQKKGDYRIHWVSVQDLILKASWATEEEMFRAVLPQRKSTKCLLVLDDIDAVVSEEDRESLGGEEARFTNDTERRLVWNTILQVIDKTSLIGGLTVIGITKAGLPREITKIGRLEKWVSMHPPSQRQRELILPSLLKLAGVAAEKRSEWAERLAAATPGCVAADLHHLCSDAWTRAMANRPEEDQGQEVAPTWDNFCVATQKCIPSQLALLNVTKPPLSFEISSKSDWIDVHSQSWSRFVGYDAIKKRLFRTVVVPWRRSLAAADDEASNSASIAPPTGVIFHGPSGTGKTLGASCLGGSLGFPMIKVRAADVLDKWLGGSEAAIRSLFASARAASPCILFFDEIDAIASNRAQDGETADVMSRLLSTLLNEMDGVSSGRHAKVLVVACTNRLEALDSALVRPGRLEEHVQLENPSVADVEAILRFGIGKAPLDETINFLAIAKKLVDLHTSGAQIEGIGRDATLRWLREDDSASSVSSEHIANAITAMNL